MFNQDKLIKWLGLPKVDVPFDTGFHCASRDIFQARLDNLYQEIPNPLLVAVAGEIGNNSFDHNLGSWTDISGIFFMNLKKEKLLIIADRGQGIKKTLGRIIPDLKNDKEAIEIAFTKTISGRSPEQRGNGLKFVSSVVRDNGWNLFFQSGNAIANITGGQSAFSEAQITVRGCVAILRYNR